MHVPGCGLVCRSVNVWSSSMKAWPRSSRKSCAKAYPAQIVLSRGSSSILDWATTERGSAEVGSRLPHGWLGDGRSTLDLVPSDAMVLFTLGAHDRWADAVAAAPVPVRLVRLGDDATVGEDWRALCGLGTDGALLVRPDQHVAWRADTMPSDPRAALAGAVATIVG